ncbi:unnamed protein product [Caenorhabditis sp. 36 PRJEB53466]|nr:unnamed protein product [Caenorhabditis sp. 36 PRJEB53466]
MREPFEAGYLLINLGPQHAFDLTQFLIEHFLKEETLNRASSMSLESFKPFVEKLLERTLHVPFSYAVLEKKSLKMVACAMSSLWKNESSAAEHTAGDEFTFGAEKDLAIEAVGKILTELHAKFFELKPDLEHVLHL